MLFMVIEKFRNHDAAAVYERLREKGRMIPEGVTYFDSWVTSDLGRCFQLMEADDVAKLQGWVARWTDLVEFEIVPVVSGAETASSFAGKSS